MWDILTKLRPSTSRIWIGFFILFVIMGLLSCLSINIKLPRYVCIETEGGSIKILRLDVAAEIKKIGESYNATVEELEKSIRINAVTMTAVNCASAFLCIMGVVVDRRNKG